MSSAKALADLRPRPEIIDLTRRAQARRIRVAALSNSWGTGDYDSYAGWDLDDLFDVVVISDRVGLRKPDRRFSGSQPQRSACLRVTACSWMTQSTTFPCP
jgi:FMN phosphatase YigB (HAD superfamily)